MKLNFFKRLSSKLYTIVPLIILMGTVRECVGVAMGNMFMDIISPPKNAFAQTNLGRNIVAYRIDEKECVYSPKSGAFSPIRQEFGCWISQKDGINKLEINTTNDGLYVYSEEVFKIREKYSVDDTLAVTGKPAFFMVAASLHYRSISGWLEFRYLQDGIAAGNFEAVVVNNVEPFDTLRIKDGTFDVKYIDKVTTEDVSD